MSHRFFRIGRAGLVALCGVVPHLFLPSAPLSAQTQWTASRPDGHAPIGVMADHTHSAGEFMFSYRYMRMEMDGNRDGTESLTTDDVLADFMVAPLNMPMNMHMVGAMYAPTDWLTLMGMGSYLSQSMEHRTRMGGEFKTSSSGFGDTRISGMFGLKRTGSVRAHLTAGVSIPTGSVDQTDVTPASAPDEAQLPYPMQTGSGTWDLLPGATVLGMTERGSWGVQASGTIRLGENDRSYTLGNAYQGTAWIAYRLTHHLSASTRVLARTWGDIEGADPAFTNPMMVPTVRTDLRAGTRVEIPVGLNWWFSDGVLAGHRIGVEMSFPVYQDLDGPQLETDWVLTVGWQKSFAPLGHGH